MQLVNRLCTVCWTNDSLVRWPNAATFQSNSQCRTTAMTRLSLTLNKGRLHYTAMHDSFWCKLEHVPYNLSWRKDICHRLILSWKGQYRGAYEEEIFIRPPPTTSSPRDLHCVVNALSFPEESLFYTGTWLWVSEWSLSPCLSYATCSPD